MLNINASQLPEQQDFAPFTAQVPCLIESFYVDTDSRNGLQFLNLKAQVIEGQYKGRVLFDSFNGLIEGTSEAWNDAVGWNITEASGGRIRTLLEAAQVPVLTDPSQIANKTMVIDAYVSKPNADGKVFQRIRKYLPMAGVPQQQPQQQSYNPSPNPGIGSTAQNPFAGNQTPQANPFAPQS